MIYKDGYKYQLGAMLSTQTFLVVPRDIKTDWVSLYASGILVLHNGYAWDGVSCGPDLKCMMRASANHDAFYQLLRMELLPPETKYAIDNFFYLECRRYGTPWIVAKTARKLLEHFGDPAADPKNLKPLIILEDK